MTSDCIITPYALNRPGGYGAFTKDGVHYNHSRWIYCEHNKISIESIKGQLVLHTCDNPPCINPAHLFLGSHKRNMEDKVSKGRWIGGQPKKLTDSQVKEIRNTRGTSEGISKLFGVSRGTIDNVINRKSCYNYEV